MRVTNKESTSLVSVSRITGKLMQINSNEGMTSISKPVPSGTDAVQINANGDMQKL